jgi:hypothetical protein
LQKIWSKISSGRFGLVETAAKFSVLSELGGPIITKTHEACAPIVAGSFETQFVAAIF